MLTTDQKGALAEQAIAFEALTHGVGVSRPLGDERYDLILDLAASTAPNPVQMGRSARRCRGDRLYGRGRRGPNGVVPRSLQRGRDRRDCCVLSGDEELLSASEGAFGRCARRVQLRLSPPTRNNQMTKIYWARDFELGATLTAAPRAHSSAGRASAWQREGRRFEPGWVHLRSPLTGASFVFGSTCTRPPIGSSGRSC